jgi:NCS1 family nucleobase:cation symporter-1
MILANLMPSKINFKIGGLITAGFGFVIGGMWVAVITQMGLFPFVNTLRSNSCTCIWYHDY